MCLVDDSNFGSDQWYYINRRSLLQPCVQGPMATPGQRTIAHIPVIFEKLGLLQLADT
jgi:hypothetical protein